MLEGTKCTIPEGAIGMSLYVSECDEEKANARAQFPGLAEVYVQVMPTIERCKNGTQNVGRVGPENFIVLRTL